MHRTWPIGFSVLLLSLGLVSCLKESDFSSGSDAMLFNRATHAIERGKFDVARITLQTLINTYPDSDYAAKAKEILKDPAIACSVPDDTYYSRDGSPLRCNVGTV